MADKVKGIPDGLVEEPLQDSAQIQGVPAGLTAEPVKTPATSGKQSDRVADSLSGATISAPEPGLTGMLDRAYNRVKTALSGGGRPDAAVDVMGGVALGPIRAAKGVSQLPDHPVRGVNNIIGGVGQTAALPMAVVNPATLAYAAPAVTAQHVAQSGLNAIGVDPDYAELGGNIAGIAAGGAVHEAPRVAQTVKVIAKPAGKIALEAAKSIPGIGGAIKGAAAIKDVAPALREIWAKPSPAVTDNDVTIAEPAPAIAPLKATSPKAALTEILRRIGVASPAATVKPMTRVPTAEIAPRSDLSFVGSHSGDSAALNQLSENFSPDRLGINDLRGVAQSRGIKISPGDNHAVLIGKIHDSLTPEELDKFEQAASERMQPDYSLPAVAGRIPQ